MMEGVGVGYIIRTNARFFPSLLYVRQVTPGWWVGFWVCGLMVAKFMMVVPPSQLVYGVRGYVH